MPKISYRYDVMQAGEDADFLESGSVSKADYARAEVEKAFAKHPNAVYAEVFKFTWDKSANDWDSGELIASYKPGAPIPDTDFDKSLAKAVAVNGPPTFDHPHQSTILITVYGLKHFKSFGVTPSRIEKIKAAGWKYANGWKR